MSTVKNTDTIQVHYTGKTDDGVVFDSSLEREPLKFTLGQGQLIPGFEKAVLGLAVGESTSVRIPAEEAYGDVHPEMTIEVDKKQIPPDITPEIGMQLQMQQPNGQPMVVRVTSVTDTQVTLDANHPLAGEALNFDIEVVAIH